MKKLRYLIEAIFIWLAFALFRILPVDAASATGGWIGRTIGPRLGASKKARKNLEGAFPEKTPAEIDEVIRGMWDNLGRVMAEYPHLSAIVSMRCETRGLEHLSMLDKNAPCVVIGAHLANWELLPFFFNAQADVDFSAIYREPNNPYVARILEKCRHMDDKVTYIAKSPRGVRDMVRTLKNGRWLANLIDQKYNRGLPVPFFGRPAMTSPAFLQLARTHDAPILPFQIERLSGCRFRITIHPPFRLDGRDDETALRDCYAMLEGWIRQNPAQWLWLHRRWDSKALKNLH